jgi:hypothetical protein
MLLKVSLGLLHLVDVGLVGCGTAVDALALAFESGIAIQEIVDVGDVPEGGECLKIAVHEGLLCLGLSVVLRSKDINPGHICCRLIASLRKLEGRDDIYKRLVKSLIEAEELVANDHQKSVEIIAKWIKLDTALVNKAFYSGYVTQDTDPNVKGVEFFWDFLKDAEFIKSDKKVSQYVLTNYYRDALAELRKQNPKSEFYAQAEKIFKSRN